MKVSVILPVYNGEKYLVACLESLLKQSIEGYEIICVDDGSKDQSGQILDEYQMKYPDMLKVFHRENVGVYKAREFALRQATGEYIGFCDCDDIVDAAMYQRLYDCAVRAKAEMAVCAYTRVDAQTEKILCCEMNQFGNCVIDVKRSRDKLAIINTALWNKLIRRDIALKHIQFDTAPRVAEDMMYMLSLYPQMTHIAFCEETLYRYYVREGSQMSYVKSEEIAHLKACMEQTRDFVETLVSDWSDVISLFAFIHFGISFVLKSTSTKKEMIALQKNIEQWLDEEFSGWKKNALLTLRYVMKGHGYLFKPAVVMKMYRWEMFPIFLRMYIWITENLKMDIKW